MAANRNFIAAFNSVTAAASPLPAPVKYVVASDSIAEFIDSCDSAICCGMAVGADPLPGVDVERPWSMFKAYLLLLANEGLTPQSDALDSKLIKDWHARVTARVWRLLEFDGEPSLLTVQLAFSLLSEHGHLAPEMRALAWAVGDFAACGFMPGLRA